MAKKKELNEKEITDSLVELVPFLNSLKPLIKDFLQYQKEKIPVIKRNQMINAIVMMTILLTIAILAYHQKIDGSAATGLIGAVIGYVFGGLYQQRKQ